MSILASLMWVAGFALGFIIPAGSNNIWIPDALLVFSDFLAVAFQTESQMALACVWHTKYSDWLHIGTYCSSTRSKLC